MSFPTVFALKHTFSYHTKPINTLSISGDGVLLLSGGDDGRLVVWDLEKGHKLQVLSLPFHGPVCMVVWTPLNREFSASAFALGSADGTIQIFRRSSSDQVTFEFACLTKGHDSEVEGIAFDPHYRRIATVGSGCLKVWNMDGKCQLSLISSSPPKQFIARSVAFFDQGSSVLVCYLESHEVIAYTIDPWSMKWTYNLRHRIGYATLSADERTLLTSNLKDGIDTYSMPPNQHIRSVTHPIHRNVPLVVCSALGGTLTLAGSDDGRPRVFDQRIGLLSQSLPHGHGGTLAQVVSAHSAGSHCILATGSTGPNLMSDIKIWEEQAKPPLVESQTSVRGRSPWLLVTLSQIFTILLISLAIQLCMQLDITSLQRLSNIYTSATPSTNGTQDEWFNSNGNSSVGNIVRRYHWGRFL